MSILTQNKAAKAIDVWFTADMLHVRLEDGREISTPLEWFPKLRDASDKDSKTWRFIGSGVGIHLENLDEDISIRGLLDFKKPHNMRPKGHSLHPTPGLPFPA